MKIKIKLTNPKLIGVKYQFPEFGLFLVDVFFNNCKVCFFNKNCKLYLSCLCGNESSAQSFLNYC